MSYVLMSCKRAWKVFESPENGFVTFGPGVQVTKVMLALSESPERDDEVLIYLGQRGKDLVVEWDDQENMHVRLKDDA